MSKIDPAGLVDMLDARRVRDAVASGLRVFDRTAPDHLDEIVRDHPHDDRQGLRRAGLVEQLEGFADRGRGGGIREPG
jgi:hypothetical protein